MKIIPKYQKGGSFDSLFAVYTPIQVQAPQQTTTTKQSTKQSSKSDNGELTEKDLYSMIKDIDGLPNDMDVIVGRLLNTVQYENLTGLDTGSLATNYLQSLLQIKKASQNKKSYDDAMLNASKNGSLGEPAISMDGKLLIQNEDGSIGRISVETYNSNREEYSPKLLTVSSLADMRKFDPQLANNSSVFDIINNSMGYESFQGLLDKATSSLGSSMFSTSGMFSAEGEASKGLALLNNLGRDDRVKALGSVTAEGLYQYDIIDKNQLQQIKSLTQYILSTFPDRAKTWAAVKTGDTNKNEATEKLVLSYLLSTSSDMHTFNIQYKGSMDKVTGNDSKSNKKSTEDSIKLNAPMKWLMGLGVRQMFTINVGSNYATQVLANTMPLTDSSKKYLGPNSTLQQASQGEFSSILNLTSASMGMKKIDPSNFGKIVLTDGKISSIDFPYRVLDDGTIVPDLTKETYDNKMKADREIKQLGIDLTDQDSISRNYKEINNIYVKYGLKPAYNSDGTLSQNWTRFGVINAEASNNALGMDQFDTNPLLQEIQDDSIVDNILQITKEERDTNSWFFSGVDHFYKGTVWIPTDVSYIAASASSDMDVEQVNKIIEREAALQASKVLTKEKK